MTAGELVADLVGRGVVLEGHGDRLRYRPVDGVTEAEREALRDRKAEVLALLRRCDGTDEASDDDGTMATAWRSLTQATRSRLEAEAAAGDPLAQTVLTAVACMPHACAWRLYSRRLDRELWVIRDADALPELEADEARAGLPVILADDLERLRSLDDLTLHAVLDTCADWPGCRVGDAMPKPTR